MENDNVIIDFEEKFKDEKSNNDNNFKQLKNKNNAVLTIILYVFFLGGIAAFTMMFFKTHSSEHIFLDHYKTLNDDNVVAVMDLDEFNNVNDNYNINDNHIYNIDNNLIFISSYNFDENDSSWLIDNADDILNGNITNFFNNEDNYILLMTSKDSKAYSFINIDNKNINLYLVDDDFTVNQTSLLMFISYFLLTIILFLINKDRVIKDFNLYINDTNNPPIANLANSFATMFAVSIGLGLLSTIISLMFNVDSNSVNQQSIELMLKSDLFILIAITTVFFGPLVEELVFRLAIFDLIKNKKMAIFISSLVFGLIHIISEMLGLIGDMSFINVIDVFVTSIPYVGMGVFLAIWYEKSNRNIFLIYAVHALNNLLSVVISLFL